MDSLFEAISRFPPLSKKEEIPLFKTMRDSTGQEASEAREKIINHNIWLPCFIIQKRFSQSRPNTPIEKEDMLQSGMRALIEKALPKFNPDEGVKFSTYARWWVLNAIYRLFRQLAPVRIPKSLRSLQEEIKDLREKNKNGNLTAKDVADKLGEREERIQRVQRIPDVFRMDKERDEAQSFYKPEFPHDVEEKDLRGQLEKLMDEVLSEKEKYILKHRYGWGGKKLTLRELDDRMDICYERVRQIQIDADEKIEAFAPDHLKVFIDTFKEKKGASTIVYENKSRPATSS